MADPLQVPTWKKRALYIQELLDQAEKALSDKTTEADYWCKRASRDEEKIEALEAEIKALSTKAD